MTFAIPRSPRTLFVVAVLTAVLASCSSGDGHNEAAQHEATERRLDATARAALARNTTWPGLAAHVIADDGALSWQIALGFADIATRRPLTPDATFRIASVTKTFTAAAVYRLMEMKRS